jgi:acetate kinase
MKPAICVLNAGSSSIKFSLFEDEADGLSVRLRGQIESIGAAPRLTVRDAAGQPVHERQWSPADAPDHAAALEFLTEYLQSQLRNAPLAGVGHRVVHGGLRYSDPVRVDAEVLAELESLQPLAPLHQPHNLAPIRLLLASRPDLPQVACFDTAFHRGNPEIAQMFALPYALHEQGIRRYGFHGLSYEYVAEALAQLDEDAAIGRTVVLHLGNGCSMCALEGGRSIATTMGFTAVDGLMMGTRSGALDPGVVLYLLGEGGMSASEVERLLYSESGLLGVSGLASDMRELLASDEPRAALAVDLFTYRIRRELGALVAVLGGLDALVFTGGIGENSAVIRERVCRDAGWTSVELDLAANGRGPGRVSRAGSRVSVWVVPTDEELMIARHTQRVIAHAGAQAGARTRRQRRQPLETADAA